MALNNLDSNGTEEELNEPVEAATTVDWELKRQEDLPTSGCGAGPATSGEIHLMEMMALQENDGTYQIKNGQPGGNILRRLYCGSKNCPVIAKFVRNDGKLYMYTKHIHQNHLDTPEKGLKRPAMRYVMDNPDMSQQNILLAWTET